MPQLIRSTIYNTHRNGLIIIGILLTISMILAQTMYDRNDIAPGNWRLIFWFVTVLISFLLVGKIDRKISASLLLFACYGSFYLYPVLSIESNYAENLFILPSTLIIFTVLPYLIFEIKKEKVWIVTWILLFLITFFFGIQINLTKVDVQKFEGLVIIIENYFMLAMAYFASWFFVQVIFYRYLTSIADQQQRIKDVNDTLDEKVGIINDENKSLDDQSKELLKLQNQISKLNNELELKVRERTHELQIQTEALNKYGFANSKLIRGPIEKILFNSKTDANMASMDIDTLNNVIKDLDAITIAISDVLNAKNIGSIKRVEKMIKEKYRFDD